MKKQGRVKTPCIGVCSTGIGGSVCRGCKRFGHEVVQWNGYSEVEKGAVVERLSSLLVQVMSERITIVDVDTLRSVLDRHQVRYHSQSDPYAWLFDLLKVGAGQIARLEDVGCRLTNTKSDESLVSLRDTIDNDFLELSKAHYQRYFVLHEPELL